MMRYRVRLLEPVSLPEPVAESESVFSERPGSLSPDGRRASRGYRTHPLNVTRLGRKHFQPATGHSSATCCRASAGFRVRSRTCYPLGFCRRDAPPLSGDDGPLRGVHAAYRNGMRLACCDIRAIRALPRVDEFFCPVLIAAPANDSFAPSRQALRTGLGEQQQVLFSRPRGRYASVAATNAGDADERSEFSRDESDPHQDDESGDELKPPRPVAGHEPPCDPTPTAQQEQSYVRRSGARPDDWRDRARVVPDAPRRAEWSRKSSRRERGRRVPTVSAVACSAQSGGWFSSPGGFDHFFLASAASLASFSSSRAPRRMPPNE